MARPFLFPAQPGKQLKPPSSPSSPRDLSFLGVLGELGGYLSFSR
jgi:hypothetical protein